MTPAMNLLEIAQTLLLFLASMFSLYGFGGSIARYAFPQYRTYPGINILMGLLLFLASSGYIELFHLGSRQTFHWATIIGIVLAIAALTSTHWRNQTPFSLKKGQLQPNSKKVFAIFIAGALVIAYCINMMFHDFNRGDDYSSYLIFPLRIITEGFSGGDAFNLRGIEHGLGGGDYINALFLSLSDISSLYLAESGIGFLLLGLLCIDDARLRGGKFWRAYGAFLLACVTAIFAQYTNVTPILTGCAIGFGMLMLGDRLPPQCSIKLAAFLGALCGALIILKGNLLAPALMFLSVIFLARLIDKRKTWVLLELFAALALIALIMLPWMLASKDNHGTLFYPLLGKGFTYSGGFALVPKELFMAAAQEFIPLYSLTFAAWIVFWTRSVNESQNRFVSILCLAVVPCTLILAITPAGMYRYCYVILATPCLYVLTANLGILQSPVCKKLCGLSTRNTRYLVYLAIFVSSILMLHQIKRVGMHFFHDSLYVRYLKLDQSSIHDIDMLASDLGSTAERYSQMQGAIPFGKVVIAQVEAPFLLDYSRNKIWVMDYPGSAGPRPPPYDGSDEDLAIYLREHNIRYIMHSYHAWLSRRESKHYITVDLNPVYEWNKVMAKREFLVNNQLLSLSKIYTSPYDNGKERVIDLCKPRNTLVTSCD